MNIIAICGSPRRGNTEFALKRFLTIAEEFGHKTELVLLRDKRIEHCRGCLVCDGGEKCPVLDDVGLIIERMQENEVIVFGSPNYFGNVTGLMKDFFDRLNPCYVEGVFEGKKFVGTFVGEDMSSSEGVTRAISDLSEAMKAYFIGDIYLIAKNDQDLENNAQEIEKLDEFVRNILK